ICFGPGSSLSSDSGVLPTNWRLMKTDAPGTSESNLSEANVGAADGLGATGATGAAFFGVSFFVVVVVDVIGEGGSTFFGTMRDSGAGVTTSAGLGRGRCRKYAVPPITTTAATVTITPRFIVKD